MTEKIYADDHDTKKQVEKLDKKIESLEKMLEMLGTNFSILMDRIAQNNNLSALSSNVANIRPGATAKVNVNANAQGAIIVGNGAVSLSDISYELSQSVIPLKSNSGGTLALCPILNNAGYITLVNTSTTDSAILEVISVSQSVFNMMAFIV